jgi:uncharacterized membrane protein HdeD (DUF308 family)
MISMSTVPMRVAKTGYIVLSAGFIVLGILLAFFPEFSVDLACDILGGIMMGFGAFKIAGYLSKDLYRLAFQYDLPLGCLFVILGVLIIAYPVQTMAFFSVVLGISILADGLFKIQIAMDSRRFGIDLWWLILVLALLSGLAAALLIFYPSTGGQIIVTIFGVALICEGIQNLIAAAFLVKIISHQLPDDDIRGINEF